LKYIEDAKKKEEESDTSYKKVPKFYQKSQASQNQLGFKVRHEARNRFLKHKTSEVLDKEGIVWLIQTWSCCTSCSGRITHLLMTAKKESTITVSSQSPPSCR
jgi:serine/threonine-protein phosphatase 2A regulatory subunit B''